jgi:uncharacterized protein (TIGR03000 family)
MNRLIFLVTAVAFAFPAMAEAQVRVMRTFSINTRPAPAPPLFSSTSTLVLRPNILAADLLGARVTNRALLHRLELQNFGYGSAYMSPYYSPFSYSPYVPAYPFAGYPSSGYSSSGYSSYPMTQYGSPPPFGGYSANSSDYGSGYSTPAAKEPEVTKGSSAVIIIHVPLALVDVAVNGVKMKETGKSREYIAKGLEPDKSYSFTVQANWTEGGVAQSAVREVSVSAGQIATVNIGRQQ